MKLLAFLLQLVLIPAYESLAVGISIDAGIDTPNSGETAFTLAPGLKYTRGDLIIEGLVRFPVSQNQKGMQMEIGNMYLIGIRHMY